VGQNGTTQDSLIGYGVPSQQKGRNSRVTRFGVRPAPPGEHARTVRTPSKEDGLERGPAVDPVAAFGRNRPPFYRAIRADRRAFTSPRSRWPASMSRRRVSASASRRRHLTRRRVPPAGIEPADGWAGWPRAVATEQGGCTPSDRSQGNPPWPARRQSAALPPVETGALRDLPRAQAQRRVAASNLVRSGEGAARRRKGRR
jgi:hypothetical protein